MNKTQQLLAIAEQLQAKTQKLRGLKLVLEASTAKLEQRQKAA